MRFTRMAALLAAASLTAAMALTTASPASADPPTVLDVAHVDMAVAIEEDGSFFPHAHDEDNDLEYQPSDVIFQAKPNSETVSPGGAYSFLGPAGTPVWILPQVQDPDLLWLGYATEEIESGVVEGDVVDWTLLDVDGPGDFHLFTTGAFGEPTILFDSPDGFADDVLPVPTGVHAHANWSFGAEGTYTVTVQYDAVLVEGSEPISTGPVAYTFVVGELPPPPAGSCVAPGPSVSVGDVSVAEGDAGKPLPAKFSVTLSEPSATEVVVGYDIVADPSDVVVKSGTAKFKPKASTGLTATSKPVAVKILPDVAIEGDETYSVELTSVTPGYSIAKGIGAGVIVEDDPGSPQNLSVGDVSICEGDSGTTASAFVPIALSEPASGTVTVTYSLGGGTATAGDDYIGLNKPTKSVTFKPGAQVKYVNVKVLPDTEVEGDETVSVDVVGVSGPATVVDGTGVVTIGDNDS